jgi:hypothetical protein
MSTDLIVFAMVYAGYIGVIVLLCRSRHRLAIAGFFVGYTTWLYDWDFCLNFGGPSTPISDYICARLGFQHCCCGNPEMLVPLLALLMAGGAVGLILWIPFHFGKKQR